MFTSHQTSEAEALINEDTAANEGDQARHGEGPVEDKHGVQALLTHEVTARKKVVNLV